MTAVSDKWTTKRARVNETLWKAFSDFHTPFLATGQVWRLCWNEDCAIAVICLHGKDDSLTALPMTEDVQFATNYDLVLQANESPLGMPSMIQVALESGIGPFVLERCLGSIGDDAARDLADLRASFVLGEDSPHPLGRVGPPISNGLDERLQYRSAQREAFAPIALAEWVECMDDTPVPVADLMSKKIPTREPSPALRQMSAATGIPIKDLVRLWRSEGGSLDHEQATLLADFLDVERSSLLASLSGGRVPRGLVDAMNHPTQKPRLYRYAHEWKMDEAETRRRIAMTLIGTKKRAGELSSDDWERLLEDHFPQ